MKYQIFLSNCLTFSVLKTEPKIQPVNRDGSRNFGANKYWWMGCFRLLVDFLSTKITRH